VGLGVVVVVVVMMVWGSWGILCTANGNHEKADAEKGAEIPVLRDPSENHAAPAAIEEDILDAYSLDGKSLDSEERKQRREKLTRAFLEERRERGNGMPTPFWPFRNIVGQLRSTPSRHYF